MPDAIIVPTLGDSLIESSAANIMFHTWMASITEAVNNLQPLTGSGSPEGVQVASTGRWYVDTTAAVGSGVYFKESGDGNTGWVLRS